MNTQADDNRHPFLDGLSKHRGAVPTVMVIFGASGDLTSRKLVPAIFNLAVDNLCPEISTRLATVVSRLRTRRSVTVWQRRLRSSHVVH